MEGQTERERTRSVLVQNRHRETYRGTSRIAGGKLGTGIKFKEAKPECIIELDEFAGEHRNCDLVVLCNVGTKRMVINVEAKAAERFGDLIGEYFDRKAGSGSKVPARIRQL